MTTTSEAVIDRTVAERRSPASTPISPTTAPAASVATRCASPPSVEHHLEVPVEDHEDVVRRVTLLDQDLPCLELPQRHVPDDRLEGPGSDAGRSSLRARASATSFERVAAPPSARTVGHPGIGARGRQYRVTSAPPNRLGRRLRRW